MNREEQKFLGKLLFTFDGWDDIEIGFLQFYDVEFPFRSMEKYNGCIVTLQLDGIMEIYNGDYEKVLWKGFPIDIEEWNLI